MKLCIINNYAAHYRSSIFKLIDREFDCDFFFGKEYLDIKKMDYNQLRGNVTEVETIHLLGGITYRKGILKQLKKAYNSYLVLGETHSLSTWLFCIKARLFHRKAKGETKQ